MNSNIYLQNYLRIEKEVKELSYYVSFDVINSHVHSPYICDLILRCASDIESIAKEIYITNFDANADRKKLKFDYDCIEKMIGEWSLNEKTVFLKDSSYSFFSDALTPFMKINIDGKDNYSWNFAYQALKHDKVNSICEHATLDVLINIVSALFILNLYYANYEREVGFNGFLDSHLNDDFNPSKLFHILVDSGNSNENLPSFIPCDIHKASIYYIEFDVKYVENKKKFDELGDDLKTLEPIQKEILKNELLARHQIKLNKRKF